MLGLDARTAALDDLTIRFRDVAWQLESDTHPTVAWDEGGLAVRRFALASATPPQRLALDGTYLRERAYTGMGAGLASDGTGLLITLVVNSAIGDRADSVLSLEAVAGGGQAEIARTKLQRAEELSKRDLIAAADLYAAKKLDMPKRGNALCKVAMETLALMPNGKERQQLETKAKEELKRFKVEA